MCPHHCSGGRRGKTGGGDAPCRKADVFNVTHFVLTVQYIEENEDLAKNCWRTKRKTRNLCTRYRKHWKKPYQTLRISAPPLFSVRVQSAVWAPFKNTKNFLLKWLESLPEKVNHNYDTACSGRAELKLTFLRNHYQGRSKRTFPSMPGHPKNSNMWKWAYHIVVLHYFVGSGAFQYFVTHQQNVTNSVTFCFSICYVLLHQFLYKSMQMSKT